MSWNYQFVRGTLLVVVMVLGGGWMFYRWVKNSREPVALVIQCVVTAIVAYGLVRVTAKGVAAGAGGVQLYGILFAAVCGIVIACIWVPVLGDFLGRKFGSIFDGGDEAAPPRPFYSIFQAKRTMGKYFEALTEIRKQLDKFPTDFEGQMMLASLQAENLNDLPGAELTIQRLCAQNCHPPANLSYALNHLADWHLKITKDADAARAALERIVELLPDTEMALQASQRIGRLADSTMLLASSDRERISVKKGVENLGLLRGKGALKAPEVNQEALADEYVAHLQVHPLDGHIRERLAVLYADHYHRLDLATDQLEQLIQQPNQPAKQVMHWLNVLADLRVREGAGYEAVHETLQRIVDQYPDHPEAEKAVRRMDILKLELKAKEKSRAVTLGSYEKNIGLKRAK